MISRMTGCSRVTSGVYREQRGDASLVGLYPARQSCQVTVVPLRCGRLSVDRPRVAYRKVFGPPLLEKDTR